MKHEHGMNLVKTRQLSRAVLYEAVNLLEVMLDNFVERNEACVMRLIASLWCDGLTREQIAEELGMSVYEVYRYLTIMQELCSSAIMACESDEFVEQVGLFGDCEDLIVRKLMCASSKQHYKRQRSLPLFDSGGN